MATDYIPATDSDFLVWLSPFSALITATPTAYGLTTGNATTLAGLTSTYSDALMAAQNGETRGPSTVSAKDTARANAEAYARELATLIQANKSVTNEQKTNLRITVRKTTRTPVPAPTTRPVLSFVSGGAMAHTLRYNDETTPDSRKRPFGSAALMLSWWIVSTGTTPTGPANFVRPITNTPFTIEFTSGDVGKTAIYSAKWVTATGLEGLISNTVTATVMGTTS